MPAAVAMPKNITLTSDEVAVTVVVPAPKGCNLNCGFCFIRARREANPSHILLQDADYVQFVAEMAVRKNVGLVSLQGYEPLLPESWPASRAILKKARELGVRAALVTNGTHLAERVDELVALGVGGLTVSLDASHAPWHDQTRRTAGAFDQTMAGIERASASMLHDKLIVASVLQRGKLHYLRGVPQLLADLGLRFWVVTATYKVGRGTAEPPADIVRELTALDREALRHGVSMLVDDEFDALIRHAGKVIDLAQLRLRRFSRLNQVVRLSPDGTCAVGSEIMDRSSAARLVWDPRHEAASAFSDRVAAAV